MRSVIATQRALLHPASDAVRASSAPSCLNCRAALVGPFCAECGQRAVSPRPTLNELARDAFAEFSGWDGKLAGTLNRLVLRPGRLTAAFLAGKRVRFISPLRLYLSCSLVYFLLAASAPGDAHVGVAVWTTPDKKPVKTAGISNEDRQQILASIDQTPALIRPLARRAAEDPARLQRDVYDSMPKALFALLPVFAAILALFYRKRHFAEHLYFAIHVHAFVFVAMGLAVLVKWTRSDTLSIIAGVLMVLWIPIYGHLALRRVYGGSHARTLVKELGIGALYTAASIPALMILAMWVASRSA